MNYNLFLDDLRQPHQAYIYLKRNGDGIIVDNCSLKNISGIDNDQWIIVRSYNEFVKIIEKHGLPKVVSFDHDLSMDYVKHYYKVTEKTGIIEYGNLPSDSGYHCAKFICQKCLDENVKFPKYFIHSANKWGAENIQNYIENFIKLYPNLQK